jgi:glycosyltransferase involved in cell wall biosynthesis
MPATEIQEELDSGRRAMGWSVPDFGRARIVVDPDDAAIRALVEEDQERSTHIFTTIRAYPVVKKSFLRCVPTRARMGLLVESQDFRGWKGWARWALARTDALRYGRRLAFILAMGDMGVRWFRRCGFPEEKIFPYGYWVETPSLPPPAPPRTEAIQLMFLGQLVPRKGVDLLLRALAGLADCPWRLTLMGGGPSQPELEVLARRLGIADRVAFVPSRSNEEAVARIVEHDLFILPSRFDGWGAVVNEALMCGVPVLCSSHCGAAELLQDSWRGGVFPAYSAPGLRRALEPWLRRGKRTEAEAERIRRWSRRIEGTSAARYLLQVARADGRGARPVPPWRAASGAPDLEAAR